MVYLKQIKKQMEERGWFAEVSTKAKLSYIGELGEKSKIVRVLKEIDVPKENIKTWTEEPLIEILAG